MSRYTFERSRDGHNSIHCDGWIIGSTDKEYVNNHKGEQIVVHLTEDDCNRIESAIKDVIKLK